MKPSARPTSNTNARMVKQAPAKRVRTEPKSKAERERERQSLVTYKIGEV